MVQIYQLRDRYWQNLLKDVTKLQEAHFKYSDIDKLKVKRCDKIYHANINQNRPGMAILISSKVDFRGMKIIRDRERDII